MFLANTQKGTPKGVPLFHGVGARGFWQFFAFLAIIIIGLFKRILGLNMLILLAFACLKWWKKMMVDVDEIENQTQRRE
ncbi:hypothetical protein [Volucribacter amazonae]|uniref:Uncharacterized protein n=1 Tax=Volucribacter amazonae TaxID=256731 RepID=A0A9X4PB95_9PAST|nr:hypothetical protein [Volucribacter amazonae]MDG6894391.1 hypothetical protein [Volucribacter amazonae]